MSDLKSKIQSKIHERYEENLIEYEESRRPYLSGFLDGLDIAEQIVLTTFEDDKNQSNQWIPVTDKLPEEDGIYLVYCKDKTFEKYGRIDTEIRTIQFYKSIDKFADLSHVTHWQYLPEPPKEEQDEKSIPRLSAEL